MDDPVDKSEEPDFKPPTLKGRFECIDEITYFDELPDFILEHKCEPIVVGLTERVPASLMTILKGCNYKVVMLTSKAIDDLREDPEYSALERLLDIPVKELTPIIPRIDIRTDKRASKQELKARMRRERRGINYRK